MNVWIFSVLVSSFLFVTGAWAEGDLSRADVQEIELRMGTNDDGSMYFEPSHLELVTGQAYKIVLINEDEIKHEFAGHEFVEKLFTRKVEIEDEDGELVAEIKGLIREVEVGPHQEVEWFVVPIQTGENIPIECELEGHAEAGMVGTVTIR